MTNADEIKNRLNKVEAAFNDKSRNINPTDFSWTILQLKASLEREATLATINEHSFKQEDLLITQALKIAELMKERDDYLEALSKITHTLHQLNHKDGERGTEWDMRAIARNVLAKYSKKEKL